MKLKSIIKRSLLGLDIPNEYVCISKNSFLDPLQVSLKINDELMDVTTRHILLGYKPLLLGLYFPLGDDKTSSVSGADEVTLQFNYYVSIPTGQILNVAHLEMRKVGEKQLGDQILFVYEGLFGEHRFLNKFHQMTNRLHERIQFKKPGNIGLPGNLYDQVAIAYAVPRNISVVSLGQGKLFNFFPTDLHGPVGNQFYVGSLRHEGKAGKQVQDLKEIAISSVNVEAYRDIYALGKNHMAELKPVGEFDTFSEKSERLGLPLPKSVVSYRELQTVASFDLGIHRIHCYQNINERVLKQDSSLAHIHKYYAQWRLDRGLQTQWFLR